MRVFFVQGQPGCSEQTQRRVIKDHTGLEEGADNTRWYIPRPGKNAEDLTAAAKRARGGAVEIAYGLRPLGNSRASIVAALKKAREDTEEPFHILDVVSGLRSDWDGVEMLDAALAKIHGESAMGTRAQELGELGAKARVSKLHLSRMPRDDAERLWRDPSIPTDKQAARLSGRGWSLSTMRREFGESGIRKPGRRKKDAPPTFVTPISETVKDKRRKKAKAKRRKSVTKRKRK